MMRTKYHDEDVYNRKCPECDVSMDYFDRLYTGNKDYDCVETYRCARCGIWRTIGYKVVANEVTVMREEEEEE